MKVQIGQKAPDFTLKSTTGLKTLSDYRGKWIVLYFYPKDDTPSCTLEARGFSERIEEFDELNAKVIGISKDSCEMHDRFIKKYELSVLLLSDPEHRVQERYGVWKEKSFMGKRFFGTIRSTLLVDPNGVIRRIWDNVRPIGHVEEVLDSLKGIK